MKSLLGILGGCLLWASAAAGQLSPLIEADTTITTTTRIDTVVVADTVITPDTVYHHVMRDTVVQGEVLVPKGHRWLIGQNVTIHGVLRTDSGTIVMRPGSSLTFGYKDPYSYVEGGMRYDSTKAGDWGIWVGHLGVLDIQGTPKRGWAREFHSSWASTDELWIAPTNRGDRLPRRWYPGDSIPQADPRMPVAEIANVTRDVSITGGHIHISSSVPSILKHFTYRDGGVMKPAGNGFQTARFTTGRYAIHLHMMGWGSRGMVVEGVALVGSKSRGFVPHGSNGVTFVDNVAVNAGESVLWWDQGDSTDSTTVDRMLALGVYTPANLAGETPRMKAFTLNSGRGNALRNSVATGTRGGSLSHGFNWPSSADNGEAPAVWVFENNLAHNNEGTGHILWFNDKDPHIQTNTLAYLNANLGGQNGAYTNGQKWVGGLFLDGFEWHSGSALDTVTWTPAGMKDVTIERRVGSPLELGFFNKPTNDNAPATFENCHINPKDGVSKAVLFDAYNLSNPFKLVFKNCRVNGVPMAPGDFHFAVWPAPLTGSWIRIVNADGTGYLMEPNASTQTVNVTPF